MSYEERYNSILPHYVEEYKTVRDNALSVHTEDGFSFALLSDTHIDYKGGAQPERPVIEREIDTILELAKTAKIDCVILGGDLIHGTADQTSSTVDLKYFANAFKDCPVPVLVTRGNHDANDYHGKPCAMFHIITQEMWTDILLDPVSKNLAVHDPNNSKSTYYYVDFPEKKTRVIVLDCYNYPVVSTDGRNCDWTAETWSANHGIEDTQIDWLAGVAISAELDGWNYVISSHAPLVGSEGFGGRDKVVKVLSHLNNGYTYTLSDGRVIDYSTYNSYAPLSVNGHTHVNAFMCNDVEKFVQIGVGSGKVSYYESKLDYYANSYTADWVYHPYRQFGDITEATFDVITLSDSGQANRFAFGAGEDNHFDISSYIKK